MGRGTGGRQEAIISVFFSGGAGGFCFRFFLVPVRFCLVTTGTGGHGLFVFFDVGSNGFLLFFGSGGGLDDGREWWWVG